MEPHWHAIDAKILDSEPQCVPTGSQVPNRSYLIEECAVLFNPACLQQGSKSNLGPRQKRVSVHATSHQDGRQNCTGCRVQHSNQSSQNVASCPPRRRSRHESSGPKQAKAAELPSFASACYHYVTMIAPRRCAPQHAELSNTSCLQQRQERPPRLFTM